MKRAVFLDRDGVINRKAPEGGYVTRWENFEFLPGVAEAISSVNRAGWSVIVVTNQRCIAKGLVSAGEVEAIHRRMREQLARMGARVDGVYYCPHDREPACSCRKPEPGLLLAAAREFEIDLSASWVVGDSETDVEAGRRAGCRTVRIGADSRNPNSGDLVAQSLFEACQGLLERS
jgi:D-glycero-D-manno-heptose 1,7-bisphosphate phosphatase